MKTIEVYTMNRELPIIYKSKDHLSLTTNIKEGCLQVYDIDGILLILPLSQLKRVEGFTIK